MDESEEPDVVNIDENIQVPSMSPLTLTSRSIQQLSPNLTYRSPVLNSKDTTMELISPKDQFMLSSARILLNNKPAKLNNEEVSISVSKEVRRRSIFDKDEKPAQDFVKVHHEQDNDKIPKYIRSEKGNKKMVIWGISVGTLFWILVFILSYVFFERWFFDQNDKLYSHIGLNMGRSSHITFLNGFISEEISTTNATAIYDHPGNFFGNSLFIY